MDVGSVQLGSVAAASTATTTLPIAPMRGCGEAGRGALPGGFRSHPPSDPEDGRASRVPDLESAPIRCTSFVSVWVWRSGDSELTAYHPDQPGTDVAMPGERRNLVIGSPPLCVLRSSDLTAAVSAEVALKVAALHAAGTNRKCSRSEADVPPASSSSGVNTVPSASRTFSRASSRVRPWLTAPGTSKTRATIQPSSSGLSKEIVKSTDAAMAKTVARAAARRWFYERVPKYVPDSTEPDRTGSNSLDPAATYRPQTSSQNHFSVRKPGFESR